MSTPADLNNSLNEIMLFDPETSRPVSQFTLFDEKLPAFNEIRKAATNIFGRKGQRIHSAYTSMKRKWTKNISSVVLEKEISPLDKIGLHMIWFDPTGKRDLDNSAAFTKFILDGIVEANVIKNDGPSHVVFLVHTFADRSIWKLNYKLHKTKKKGVMVNIYEIRDKQRRTK